MKLNYVPGLKTEMREVERYIAEYLSPVTSNEKVNEIVYEINQSKGKRLRPMLLLLAGRFGENYETSKERLCKLGALVELVHMASLIHDDVVDDSPTRRGRPTIQSKFGKDMAVYAGDLILGRILQIMFEEGFLETGRLLGKTVTDMCVGEIGQFDCRYHLETPVSDYMKNIYGKTVAMFEFACKSGCMESGCDTKTMELITSMGEHLGYMFQIRDDLLDFFGDEKEGKPNHMDFREGVYTLPILHAVRNENYRERLEQLSNRAQTALFSKEDEAELDYIVAQSGGLDAAIEIMANHMVQAENAVDQLPELKAKKVFSEILQFLELPDMRKPVKKIS